MTFRFLLTMVVVLTTVGAGSCAAAIWGGFLPMLACAGFTMAIGFGVYAIIKAVNLSAGTVTERSPKPPKGFRRK